MVAFPLPQPSMIMCKWQCKPMRRHIFLYFCSLQNEKKKHFMKTAVETKYFFTESVDIRIKYMDEWINGQMIDG